MKRYDFLKIFKKLEMEIREGSRHTIAEFWYKNKLISRTYLSRSREIKGNVPHFIRQQLFLNEYEFENIYRCEWFRPEYIKVLCQKGKIP